MVKEKIIVQLQKVLEEIGLETRVIGSLQLDIPTDLSHGDYTTNIALQLSKTLKKSPIQIAQEIRSKLNEKPIDGIEKIEAVNPGFINFTIAKKELIRNMSQVLGGVEKIALSKSLKNKKILIEYAHPNTHKEMHIGHMRTLITGEALARLLESQNATVFRANYQGDIGLHVAKALYGIQKLMKERSLTIDEIEKWSNYDKAHFLGQGYVYGSKEYDSSKKEIDVINTLLYQAINPDVGVPLVGTQLEGTKRAGTSPADYISLYQITRQWSLDYYEEFYNRFSTKFDRLFFESQMVTKGIEVVTQHIGKVFIESEGAVVFAGEQYGLHTRVFITKSGNPTYEGKEMGNAFAEYAAFPFDRKVHIVANEQTGYFQIVFKALELIDPDKFKDKQFHLPMGMVQLADQKISSRTGIVLTVDWLIDQVKIAVEGLLKEGKVSPQNKSNLLEQIAIGAVKYSVLKVSCKQNVAFDIKTSVSLEGNSGPYIQYTYARTQSILRKSRLYQGSNPPRPTGHSSQEEITEKQNIPSNGSGRKELSCLTGGKVNEVEGWVKDSTSITESDQLLYNKAHYEIEEYRLIRQIYQFPEVVQKAAESYSPNVVCEYLFTLAQEFNLFYQKHRIVDAADVSDQIFRLNLTQAVGEVISEGLRLLGIAAPSEM